MTQALAVEPGDKVLEIGTGSGYQAAVLARLVKTVHTIEIVAPLATRAGATLQRARHRERPMSAPAMAILAGPKKRPSMASSSPLRPMRCRRR